MPRLSRCLVILYDNWDLSNLSIMLVSLSLSVHINRFHYRMGLDGLVLASYHSDFYLNVAMVIAF